MNTELEHEIKILNIDSARVEKRIHELAGKQILDDLTTMEWFDFHSSFNSPLNSKPKSEVISQAVDIIFKSNASLREKGILLRLRKQGNVFDLTLKEKVSRNDSLITTNSEVSEQFDEQVAQNVRKELLDSGFYVIAVHEKKRKSYILSIEKDEVRLDLDTWPSIPQYMEIEGKNTELISKAIFLLGVEENETSNLIAEEFFAKYGVDFFSNLSFN